MLCKSYKRNMEKELDDGGSLYPQTKLHIKQCPDCRAYYQQLMQLNERLKTLTSHPLSETQLEQLMNTAIETIGNQPANQTEANILRFITLAIHYRTWAAVCAALLLIIVGFLVKLNHNREKTDLLTLSPIALITSSPINKSVSAAMSFPEKSILKEMQSLVDDTRHVTTFLTNLIPTDPSHSLTSLEMNETD